MKVEYNWQKSETFAHAYILPGVLNILDSLGVDKRAYIFDTGCGGGYVTYTDTFSSLDFLMERKV